MGNVSKRLPAVNNPPKSKVNFLPISLVESNNGLFFKSISGKIHCSPTIAKLFDKRLLPAKFNNG